MTADYAPPACTPDCSRGLQDSASDCPGEGAGLSRSPPTGCPGHAAQLQVNLSFCLLPEQTSVTVVLD